MMTVRALTGRHEFADVVNLQRMIWGWEDLDILPVRFFVVASDIGGQILGAFDDNFLCGFCVAIPGVRPGPRPYLHSHMLGVLPEYRDSGAGRMLKLAQREDALARGFNLVEWTFDPLEIKNAYFNVEKLGAIVRSYVPNMYGIRTSMLDGDLPTDRCIAEWWIEEQPRMKSPVAVRVSLPSQKTLESQQALANELQRYFSEGLAITGFE